MSQKAITINTPSGTEAHITAEDDAFIYHSLLGRKSGILGGLTCVRVSDNTVRLSGGGASNLGHILRIPDGESCDLTVTSGSQGVSRHDLVAAQFTCGSSSVADTLEFVVVKGSASASPADPTLTTSSLLSAGEVNQVALFRLVISGTTLASIEQVAPSLPETGRSFYSGSTEPTGAAAGDVWFVTA